MDNADDNNDETLHEPPYDDSCKSDEEEKDVRTDLDYNTTTIFDASRKANERKNLCLRKNSIYGFIASRR